MLHTKYALLFTIMILTLHGCGQNQESASSDENGGQRNTANKEYNIEHEVIDTGSLDLSKNNGEKWKADTVTGKQMHNINGQVEEYGRKLREVSVADYHKLAKNIERALNRIENKAELNQKAKTQFKKIANALKEEVKVLKKDDKQASQVALVNISELLKAYRQYFN